MQYTTKEHSFIICAYGENKYLENCIQSVLSQTVKSCVAMTCSTPNAFISDLAEKYGIPLFVNKEEHIDVFHDINFAYKQADTPLVTLCHQDDYYFPEYLERVLHYANRSKAPLLLFTDYCEDRAGQIVAQNILLRIKRIMNFPLRFRAFQSAIWIRRCILSFGDPICAPAVTFNKALLSDSIPDFGYSGSWDWKTWEHMSKKSGAFVYCPERLMAHRVWEGSLTTSCLENGERNKEELSILCEFWPRAIAKIVLKVYMLSGKSNQL